MSGKHRHSGTWRRFRALMGCCNWVGIWAMIVALSACRGLAFWTEHYLFQEHPIWSTLLYFIVDMATAIILIGIAIWGLLAIAMPPWESDDEDPYPPFIE